MTKQKTITITIDNKEYKVRADVFRRVLMSSATAFERIKQLEGPILPKVEKEALDLIRRMQFDHKDLI